MWGRLRHGLCPDTVIDRTGLRDAPERLVEIDYMERMESAHSRQKAKPGMLEKT